jgi:hypothetical protein
MGNPVIITGDGVVQYVFLTINGNAISGGIGSNAVIKAALVSKDHTLKFTDDIVQSNTRPGADWPNSKVAIFMSPENTAGITYQGSALFEIQVKEEGQNPSTWFLPCKIITGNIP